MKQRMLIAGVALAFASAAWAQGGCPHGAMELMAPDDVRASVAGPQSQFVLVEWEEVEDASRYTDLLADSRRRRDRSQQWRVSLGPPKHSPPTCRGTAWKPCPIGSSTVGNFLQNCPHPESWVYGVSADAQIDGRWVAVADRARALGLILR